MYFFVLHTLHPEAVLSEDVMFLVPSVCLRSVPLTLSYQKSLHPLGSRKWNQSLNNTSFLMSLPEPKWGQEFQLIGYRVQMLFGIYKMHRLIDRTNSQHHLRVAGCNKQSVTSLSGWDLRIFLLHTRLVTISNTVFVLISAQCAYIIQETDRAHSQLSNGGFGLKIGQFSTELRPFL